MKLKWILPLGALLVLGSFIGNYVYYSAKQLDEPIFLSHSYDLLVRDGSSFELYYIVNRQSQEEVWRIDIPGTDLFLQSNNGCQATTFTHYKLCSTTFQVNEEIEEALNENSMELRELNVNFTNGEVGTVPIGTIHLTLQNEVSPLDFQAGGSSTDNDGFTIIQSLSNTTINDIFLPFENEIGSVLQLEVGHDKKKLQKILDQHTGDFPKGESYTEDLLPIQLKDGDLISLTYRFHQNALKNPYYFDLQLIGTDQEGAAFKDGILIQYTPWFTEKDIEHIIQEAKK